MMGRELSEAGCADGQFWCLEVAPILSCIHDVAWPSSVHTPKISNRCFQYCLSSSRHSPSGACMRFTKPVVGSEIRVVRRRIQELLRA